MEKHLSVEAFKDYFLERDGWAGYVLCEVLALFLTSAQKSYRPIDTKAGVPPGKKVIRHVLAYEFLFEEELYHKTSKALGHLGKVAEWDVVEIAVLIKAAF